MLKNPDGKDLLKSQVKIILEKKEYKLDDGVIYMGNILANRKDARVMLKNIIKYVYKNFSPLSISIICIYALYLRVMSLYQRTLWADELCQLSQMKWSFFDLLKGLPNYEVLPYLSGDIFLIYPFFKIFSYNKWGLAIPNIIATSIGFYILYLICKRYFKTIWAYLITFSVVCFNATLIFHSTEIRPYAILPTLALATLYLFLKISDFNFSLNLLKRTGAVIFFLFVTLFHAYGLYIFCICWLFTVLSKYKENDFRNYLKRAIPFAAVVLSLTMPFWLFSLLGPRKDFSQENIHVFDYIPNPLTNLVGFLKAIFCNLVGYKKLYFLLLGMFVPFIFSYKDKYKQLLFLSICVILPILFILFLDLVSSYWFLQRQFIWVMPLFAFYLGWAWDSFFVLLPNLIKRK